MNPIYHDLPLSFTIPPDWIRDETFRPGDPGDKGQTARYRVIAKYDQHYGILARIARVVFALILSLTIFILAFSSGRELVKNLLFTSLKNIHVIRKIDDPTKTAQYDEIQKIRCPIAQATGMAITNGFYLTSSGKTVSLRSGNQLLEESSAVSNTILEKPVPPRYEHSPVTVIPQDCLEAAQEQLQQGAQKVAVLMLASPIEPGGGMEDGNRGQEEELCRRSDIFGFMWDQARSLARRSLYNLVDVQGAHQRDPAYSSMQNNRMIHVPQVTVFRAGQKNRYAFLETPFEVGMLVSPGLDRPRYEKVEGKTYYNRAEDEEQLRKLIMTQLKVAYEKNYDTLILGAFGCGAFHNPPELVASFYRSILTTYFQGAFRKIVFAIWEDGIKDTHNPEGNLQPFQQCFAATYQAELSKLGSVSMENGQNQNYQ